MYPFSCKLSYALLVQLLLGSTRGQTAYESIYTVDAFAAQPTCVQNCFTAGFANINCWTDVLGSMLGCANTPCATAFAAVDDCYCRADMQTAAHDLLGACIDQLCSVGDNSVNLATAASIYTGYCNAKGFTAAPASTTTAGSSKATSGTVASPASSSAQAGPASTASSTDSSSIAPASPTPSSTSSSKSNTLTIALACVGGLAAIAVTAIVLLCWKRCTRPRPSPPPPYHPLASLGKPSTQSWVSGLPEPEPYESASQVGGPAGVGQHYTYLQEPSMVSTSVNRNPRSMAGQPWNRY